MVGSTGDEELDRMLENDWRGYLGESNLHYIDSQLDGQMIIHYKFKNMR